MIYEKAEDLQDEFMKIVVKLGMKHIRTGDVACIRSFGSKSRGTVARCHALNKVMQKSLGRGAFYVLEFISEKFDKMSQEEKTKVLIHELMHIPFSFGGGFKHHDYVCERNVDKLYSLYKS